jgi:hypothetical protein
MSYAEDRLRLSGGIPLREKRAHERKTAGLSLMYAKKTRFNLWSFLFVYFAPLAIGHALWVTEPYDDGKTMRGGARDSLPCSGVLFILATGRVLRTGSQTSEIEGERWREGVSMSQGNLILATQRCRAERRIGTNS